MEGDLGENLHDLSIVKQSQKSLSDASNLQGAKEFSRVHE
jgi:hypothetical protein